MSTLHIRLQFAKREKCSTWKTSDVHVQNVSTVYCHFDKHKSEKQKILCIHMYKILTAFIYLVLHTLCVFNLNFEYLHRSLAEIFIEMHEQCFQYIYLHL